MNFLTLLDIGARPWEVDALCAQLPPEMGDDWFPGDGADTRSAKALCARCPVRVACLQDALDTHERWGIRGGVDERERRRMRKTGAVA